mmetsp:Transcript_11285/g.41832  ORF Transcript_11285/g.41832 Transcript_11285/m.41832 type:complete len:208 (+) Transcript_11285:2879-3502(+)
MYSPPNKPTMVMSSFRLSPVYPVTHTFTSRNSGSPSRDGGGLNKALSSTDTSAFDFKHCSIQNHVTTLMPTRVAAQETSWSAHPEGPVLDKIACVTPAPCTGDTTAPARCMALMYSCTVATSLSGTGGWKNVKPAMNGSHGSSACSDGAKDGMDMGKQQVGESGDDALARPLQIPQITREGLEIQLLAPLCEGASRSRPRWKVSRRP